LDRERRLRRLEGEREDLLEREKPEEREDLEELLSEQERERRRRWRDRLWRRRGGQGGAGSSMSSAWCRGREASFQLL